MHSSIQHVLLLLLQKKFNQRIQRNQKKAKKTWRRGSDSPLRFTVTVSVQIHHRFREVSTLDKQKRKRKKSTQHSPSKFTVSALRGSSGLPLTPRRARASRPTTFIDQSKVHFYHCRCDLPLQVGRYPLNVYKIGLGQVGRYPFFRSKTINVYPQAASD